MTVRIDSYALMGAQQAAQTTTRPFTVDESKPLIAANSATFTLYRTSATMNPFMYWFGGKTILVNTAYWQLLNDTSAKSDGALDWMPQFTQADYNKVITWQDEQLIAVKNAKDGSK
jgi:hypothetical protein